MSSSMSVTGLASGLPADFIEQLMAIERQPVDRLGVRQAALRKVNDAWSTVNTRMSAVRSALDKVYKAGSFDALWKVESSDATAVGVTVKAGSTPQAGAKSVVVQQLASAMTQSSTDSFSSLDASLGGRALSLTVNGVTTDVTPAAGGATLRDLVASINNKKLGVTASAVQVSSGSYQLVLNADKTGTANAFSSVSTGWTSAVATTQTAKDALLNVSGLTVTRSSNTIDDLFDGMTLNLLKTGTNPVQLTATRDVDGAVANVKKLVEEINATLTSLKGFMAYDEKTRKGGPLSGDATARRLANDLRRGLMDPVSPGPKGFAGGVGVTIGRDGLFTVDEAKLKKAFTDDFAATTALFTKSTLSSGTGVGITSTSAGTANGVYNVAVTRAATIAAITGAVVVPPPNQNETFTLTTADGRNVTVTIPRQTDVTTAVGLINTALDSASIGDIRATTVDGNKVRLAATKHGAAGNFSVTSATGNRYGLAGTAVGLDAQVTVDGTTFNGTGRSVSITNGPAAGLTLSVTGATGTTSAITISNGVGGELDWVLKLAEGTTGSIQRSKELVDSSIKLMQTRIDSYEVRLTSREAGLRRQYAALESLMGQLQSNGQWLSSQLAGLNR